MCLFLFCLWLTQIYLINSDVYVHLNDSTHHWNEFKLSFNKSYASVHHEREAQESWQRNLALINKHNSMDHSYRLNMNDFADLSLRQYLRRVVKLVGDDHSHNHTLPERFKDDTVEIPAQVDWREVGFRPIVPRQKRCGACYAFAIAHAVQAQLYIADKRWEPLSEQQIIDCSGNWGNYGCGGGSLRGALRYTEKFGIMSYKDYPYVAKKSKCQWKASDVKARITSWGMIPKGDEAVLQRAVAFLGPVAVSLNAAPYTFQFYHSGIYNDHHCTNSSLNHAVLIVGYSENYWILLNWWGKKWGEHGYMRLKKGENRCGIANFATYVIMD